MDQLNELEKEAMEMEKEAENQLFSNTVWKSLNITFSVVMFVMFISSYVKFMFWLS